MLFMKMRHLQTFAISVFVLILIGVASYMTFGRDAAARKTYLSEQYGISFQYPDSYNIQEIKQTEGQTGTIVTFTDKKIRLPINGEGPTAITVAMYDGTSATNTKDPLLSWIQTSAYSNFNLSRQTIPATTTIASQDARLYTWDGLYQGTTVATMHKGNIILFSVTYDGEADLSKRADFTDLVASVEFLHGAASSSKEIQNVQAPPKETTLMGFYTCLPHKGDGPHTMECAFGMRADSGNYYALDMSNVRPELINTSTDTRIIVSGTLVPIEQISSDRWRSYDIKGIVKVTSFKKS